MTWSKQTNDALVSWLGPRTWDTPHACDMGRFYEFVASVWHDTHTLWDEYPVRDKMIAEARKLHPNEDNLIARIIKERMEQGTLILQFLSGIRDEHKLHLLTES